MRIRPRLNRYEKREMQEKKLKHDLSGTGLFLYENNTNGDLTLPKPTDAGVKKVGPKQKFQGDSYFMKLVGSPMNLLKMVEVIIPQKGQNMKEKLILDQPDTITTLGKIEHVVVEQIPAQDKQFSEDILINESPLEGLEIIMN